MSSISPPKGTRDFLPEQTETLRSIIGGLQRIFALYGFRQWDGPSFENFDTLARKAGDAIEKEIYVFNDKADRRLGLRFEFTTSLARIAASGRLPYLPFKGFAIGKVWRYENPQMGRYREFYQADADILGSPSMQCEAELLKMATDVIDSFGLRDYSLLLNDRKILNAQLERAEVPQSKMAESLRALDKLEKIGEEGVKLEFKERGLSQNFDRIMSLVNIQGDNHEKLTSIEKSIESSQVGLEGVRELRAVLDYAKSLGVGDKILISPTLVRGLDYYTGPIFEAKSRTKELGSFAGGGRYDKLVSTMGGKDIEAVGISFGVERLIDILKRRSWTPTVDYTTVFVSVVSQELTNYAFYVADILRREGLRTEMNLIDRPLRRQIEYANMRRIPFVVILGEAEMRRGVTKLRNMQSGEEQEIPASQIATRLKGYTS